MTTLLVLWLALCTGAEPCFGQSAQEYQLKSAFVYSLAKFVEWPQTAERATPLLLGILGEDPFGPTLERITEGRTVNGRPIRIKRASKPLALTDCHILFVAAGEENRLMPYLNVIGALPILTVGETQQFTKDGGIVSLLLEQERIVLQVNVDAANRAKLKINSRVLELARIVHEHMGTVRAEK
jgi:hypothetical protein